MHAEKWFKRAFEFKDTAHELFEMGRYNMVCFFAQQAVEFYLKGKMIEKFGLKLYTCIN